jgi:hypothetical protein
MPNPLMLSLTAACFLSAIPAAADPVLCFSDITSGPRSGNSDTSQGQPAGQDGAIVTIWGNNLGDAQGNSKVFAGGAEARVYSWGRATAPADLYTRHRMTMVCFQISHKAADGPGTIHVVVGGKKSTSLPFTVRAGRICFVKTSGDDAAAGDWDHPWKSIPRAVAKTAPGDIVYVCDGAGRTTMDSYSAAVNLGADGLAGKPRALVAYPGAKVTIGSTKIERGFGHWVPGGGRTAVHWTLAKFTVTAQTCPVLLGTGYRVVGNYVTAPTGSAPEGAIEGSGNDFVVLGNELTQVGKPGCNKLYHPIYISSARTNSGPRQPTESNREIAWNYLHDNNAPRAINIYSEQASTAFMTGHRVHDNFIINQVGDGMLIGYHTTGENWIYNNIIVNAGLGPEPKEGDACSHFGINIDAGHEKAPGTVIRVYNNTIYGCGWAGASSRGANGCVNIVNVNRYTLKFANNIIYSTGEPYMSGWSDAKIPPREGNNLWFGKGPAPAWDRSAVSTDPLFVDAAKGNLHLRPGSPAIDAGVDTGVMLDFDGVPRPQGQADDVGAYER